MKTPNKTYADTKPVKKAGPFSRIPRGKPPQKKKPARAR
jgi:hypothetical protein